jgi:cytochrome P450
MGQFDPLLTSHEFAQNPYPTYHWLRREAPIYWSDLWGCWILTRYRDIVSTLQNPKRFSSVGRLTAAMELPQDVREQVQPLVRHYSQGLINVDPPDHTRLRQLVHKAFLPGTVGAMAGYVEGIVERLIEEAQPRGKMDIIWDFAYPLPVTVIARLMGVPPADHGKLKRWSGKIVEFMATPKPAPEVLMSSQDALLALQDYFRSTFRRRRVDPRDDLISALVAAEEAGERLTEEELISTCVTLLIGGHETTTYLISSGVLALIQHPEQLRKLRANPDGARMAVEEMLRYEGPFQRNRRLATEAVELDGHLIEKGQLLVQMLGAANRDPAVFPNPDSFDIERHPNRHVSFGHGPHFCIGAPLARLEAPIAINALLRRLPNLELATDELVWKNTVFRGLERLPVTFG